MCDALDQLTLHAVTEDAMGLDETKTKHHGHFHCTIVLYLAHLSAPEMTAKHCPASNSATVQARINGRISRFPEDDKGKYSHINGNSPHKHPIQHHEACPVGLFAFM